MGFNWKFKACSKFMGQAFLFKIALSTRNYLKLNVS